MYVAIMCFTSIGNSYMHYFVCDSIVMYIVVHACVRVHNRDHVQILQPYTVLILDIEAWFYQYVF